jgi:hypothetical protein
MSLKVIHLAPSYFNNYFHGCLANICVEKNNSVVQNGTFIWN